jgi:G:T/U-mismatch repair DNA glycosylase
VNAQVDAFGKQTRLPTRWPRELIADSEVWVLPSSSGRAAMTTEQRALPYQQLAECLHELPWTPVEP